MITFYYGAGSPFAWRVWLALEHKSLAYTTRILSFSDGDLDKADFAALNPRKKVPVLVDGEFALYESAAIVEYLEDAYRDSGKPLFPGTVQERARVRRMVCEADSYLAPAVNRLMQHVFFTREAEWNPKRIEAARSDCAAEVVRWDGQLRGDWLAGPMSAADCTLYPMIALALRCEKKKPDLGLRAGLPARIAAWMQGVERLPYFQKTWPPHWT